MAVDFGSDLSCVSDLDPALISVSGDLVVGQAVARRLVTARATLVEDPNYGFDLRRYLNDDLGPADIARITAGVQAEALKDERVLAVVATVTLTLNILTIGLALTTANGPFDLVIAVSATSATVLGIT